MDLIINCKGLEIKPGANPGLYSAQVKLKNVDTLELPLDKMVMELGVVNFIDSLDYNTLDALKGYLAEIY